MHAHTACGRGHPLTIELVARCPRFMEWLRGVAFSAHLLAVRRTCREIGVLSVGRIESVDLLLLAAYPLGMGGGGGQAREPTAPRLSKTRAATSDTRSCASPNPTHFSRLRNACAHEGHLRHPRQAAQAVTMR